MVNITQTGGGSQSAGPRMGVPAGPCFTSTHRGQDLEREAEAMQGLTIQRTPVGVKTPPSWGTVQPLVRPFGFDLWVNEVETVA